MEFNKTVSNPMLMGTIELLKAEDTPEHRNMFVAELQKASLMAPAVIEPEPVEKGDGGLSIAPGSKVQFPMLAAPDGRKFFMGFTDMGEYRKWQEKNKDLPFFALKFDDYAGMMLRRTPQGVESPAVGFVINPMGENIIVSKEMAAGIMAARLAYAKQQAGAGAQQGIRLTVPQGAQTSPKAGEGQADPGTPV